MVTTYLKGPEAIERAIMKTLLSHINAEIDAVWAAWAATDTADAVVVPKVYPAHINAGAVSEIYDYPTIAVTSDSGRVTSIGAPNWMETDHTLAVIVWMISDDTTIIDKLTKRYLTAIAEVLLKNQGLDGSMGFTGVDLVDYGRTPPAKLDLIPGLQQIAGWTVTVHTGDTASQ